MGVIANGHSLEAKFVYAAPQNDSLCLNPTLKNRNIHLILYAIFPVRIKPKRKLFAFNHQKKKYYTILSAKFFFLSIVSLFKLMLAVCSFIRMLSLQVYMSGIGRTTVCVYICTAYYRRAKYAIHGFKLKKKTVKTFLFVRTTFLLSLVRRFLFFVGIAVIESKAYKTRTARQHCNK